jgi:hypothetical protein
MSLASSHTVFVTAIRLEPGREDVCGITAVRWCRPDGGRSEETSPADLGLWLMAGRTRAFVKWPDGRRGPELRALRCPDLCVACGPDAQDDPLLTLPRFGPRMRRGRSRSLQRAGVLAATFTLRSG